MFFCSFVFLIHTHVVSNTYAAVCFVFFYVWYFCVLSPPGAASEHVMLHVTAAAALLATCSSSPVTAAAGGAAAATVAHFARQPWARHVASVCSLCVAMLLVFRYVPAALAPTAAVAVFFPWTGRLSLPIALFALVTAPLQMAARPAEMFIPVFGDALVGGCAAMCLLGTPAREGAVSVAWGLLLSLAHPLPVALAAVAAAARDLKSGWEGIETQLIQNSIPSSAAAHLLFMLSCSGVASAAAGVQPGALAVLYALLGFLSCVCVVAVVSLGITRGGF